MTTIEKIVTENGTILSGDLIAILTSGEKAISNDAARQRLSRIKGDVFKLRGFFADRQILFYKREISGTEEFYSGIIYALQKAGKQYYTIIQSLEFHYGQIKTDQLPAYSINPIHHLTGHLSFTSALQNLIKLGIVNINGEYVVLPRTLSEGSYNLMKSKGIEVAKNFLLIQFNSWARKIGLVSYNSSKFHSEFGKYQFNFVAPSYIGSLTKRKPKSIVPAFVFADLLIGNKITEQQIEYFINKIDVLKYQKNTPNFIPILIVDELELDALNKLKANGVVIGFTNELFGDSYKDLLNSLINLVTNAGAILKKNPDAYLDLMGKLNKLVDGKTNNLRGDLFELAVGYYQGRICKSIDIGKLIIHEGSRREIDVFGTTPTSIIICECKGYNHLTSKGEIETWLGEKVPVIRRWIINQSAYSEEEIVFEFWSTGGYTDDARELLATRKAETKKYKIDYFDLPNMIVKSNEIKSKKFTKILMEYYVKEI